MKCLFESPHASAMRALLASYDLSGFARGFAKPLTLGIQELNRYDRTYKLNLRAVVCDRDDAARTVDLTFSRKVTFTGYKKKDHKLLEQSVVQLTTNFVVHELRESLLKDGVRIFDPHNGDIA